MDIKDNGTQDTGTQQRNTYITMSKRSKQGWLDAALPLLWGAVAAMVVTVGQQLFFKPPAPQGVKLAVVDIAQIMQEFNGRVLRDPGNKTAVDFALEETARAANQLDPLMKYLSTELHPGYTLIQPQALAYLPESVPDFTDELRVLLFKRTGKFQKLEDVPGVTSPPEGAAVMPDSVPEVSAMPDSTPALPLNPIENANDAPPSDQ